ncbi:hypothetical protein [Leekyejoonella antrihumi]|uniref:Uncharacterized protein n=1 Tax=Leekyejoonella antrihumi TaxID=1660198 RepID=A0A563DVW5_9MICO|nr:hypothetical protein [Leekyejoonella antrihumi]TWP34346.1 hypothetical protein FGL98_18120 [Leekyejoonella antrihumi]
MVVLVTVGSVLVLVGLVGLFLVEMLGGESSRSVAHRQAVARRNADTLARAIRVKQALDAEAFRAHRRMVDHATTVEQTRQPGH